MLSNRFFPGVQDCLKQKMLLPEDVYVYGPKHARLADEQLMYKYEILLVGRPDSNTVTKGNYLQ